ncbi:MAG: hypothetical protein KC729_04180 [Candidatus Eisenbacteria bacterium]|uniref:Uncharacterized protein n=1 Tax=Eiseniibacteriota bacterium TaxID=2212470 RepID=A0A956LXK2_UNCEI|nr:hypothetical protein [Candidatus Eisenbacteria bacterium]
MAHHLLPYLGGSGPVVTFSSDVEHVRFDLPGARGHYTMVSPRADLFGSWYSAGAVLPWVQLHRDGLAEVDGLASPRLYGQAVVLPSLGLSTGLEIDLPLAAAAIGEAHTELIPFVGLEQAKDSWNVSATIGYRTSVGGSHAHGSEEHDEALGSGSVGELSAAGRRGIDTAGVHPEHPEDPDHDVPADDDPADDDPDHDDSGDGNRDETGGHHDHAVYPVDAHADRELLYRIGLGRSWGRASSARVFVSGQAVLESGATQRSFPTVGLEMGVPFLGLLWTPAFEMPVGADRRIESSFRLGVHALL